VAELLCTPPLQKLIGVVIVAATQRVMAELRITPTYIFCKSLLARFLVLAHSMQWRDLLFLLLFHA
jgi:hypothetical protein